MEKLFKTSKKSYVIATIVTIIVHLLLLIAISINFQEEQSSALSDMDLYEIDSKLEDFMADEAEIKPSGKDPLSDEKNKESESISKEKGSVKTSSPSMPTEPEMKPEVIEEEKFDTVMRKIEQVQILKVDTPKVNTQDTVLIANLTKKTNKNASKTKYFRNEQERYLYYQKNYRTIYNFRKVYPYALLTREIIENLNAQLANLTSDSEKKKLIRETEKELFLQYESAVRTMTTSQGRLLLKLIARETNKTAFDLIKGYKGGFTASFWYGVGKIFNTDLKSEFHKEKEDSLLEDVLIKYQKNDL